MGGEAEPELSAESGGIGWAGICRWSSGDDIGSIYDSTEDGVGLGVSGAYAECSVQLLFLQLHEDLRGICQCAAVLSDLLGPAEPQDSRPRSAADRDRDRPALGRSKISLYACT